MFFIWANEWSALFISCSILSSVLLQNGPLNQFCFVFSKATSYVIDNYSKSAKMKLNAVNLYRSADISLVGSSKFLSRLINFLQFFLKSLLHAAPLQWIPSFFSPRHSPRTVSCSAGSPTPADGKRFVLGVGLQTAAFLQRGPPPSLLAAWMNLPFAKTGEGRDSWWSGSCREV